MGIGFDVSFMPDIAERIEYPEVISMLY
jgi:hypothetical protein